ncbi:PepSY-associated TM helix domain-containing protein [Pseudoalteromonas neustonica]|uniref:PepSY-associated TM helix domain-containing protein n=1 Tax=Pseudoalteromonas neustonica TaxID=1840331 RepID=A0ABU9U043_9GAMM
MRTKTLSRLTRIHNWLGLITGCGLIMIFLMGSLLFFRAQLMHWQIAWLNSDSTAQPMSYGQLYKEINKKYPSISEHGMYLMEYGEKAKFHAIYMKDADHQSKTILINRFTGNILDSVQHIETLSDFLYFFHIRIVGPIGTETVAILSVFLMVVVLGGIVIRTKDMFKKFYQYRIERAKDLLKDGHILLSLSLTVYLTVFALSGAHLNISNTLIRPGLVASIDNEKK